MPQNNGRLPSSYTDVYLKSKSDRKCDFSEPSSLVFQSLLHKVPLLAPLKLAEEKSTLSANGIIERFLFTYLVLLTIFHFCFNLPL